ncbi:caspase-3-like [Diadema setosum]|uniref:caspase-3-like n=1 Tax=Diadema setosum TaxID=31175 RepID=UPI003B3A8B3D
MSEEEIQREMLRKLRNDITDAEFDMMKKEIQQQDLGGFGPGEIQRHVKTIDDMFEKLLRKGIFKVGNYRKLHKLFSLIGSEHLRETINAAEKKLKSKNYPVQGEDSAQQVPQQGEPIAIYPGGHIPPGGAPTPFFTWYKAYTLPRGSSSEEDSEFYEPGKCYVLFINNLFTGRSDYRTGAERDEENVQRLFKDLGGNFCLEYIKDVTKGQLDRYLSDLQNTLGSGSYKSFIFILGSHGEPQSSRTGGPEKDGVLMADDSWMLVDDIIKNFHGDKIPKMRDRPKIFIIQSCRGKESARWVSYPDGPGDLSSQGMMHNMESFDVLTRPVNSDVLIAYATTEGTKAFRNHYEGSWFVHDLCDVIAEFKDKEHILDILVRVNKKMARRESTKDRAKQMPCFVCTFTKRFMFIPK